MTVTEAQQPCCRSTDIIENMMGTIRRVCRNVKHWRDASMALRWTAAAMQEVTKGFRRLKARSQLPLLRAALAAHQQKGTSKNPLFRRDMTSVEWMVWF